MRRRRRSTSSNLGRLLTALLFGLGIGAIALAMLPQPAPRAPAPALPSPVDAPALAQPATPARPAAASRQTAALPPRSSETLNVSETRNLNQTSPVTETEAPSPTPPPFRQPAPREARPAVEARSLDNTRLTVRRAVPPPAPFSVVVSLQDPATVGPLGQQVVDGLNRDGVQARIAPIEEAGRPDVILALNAVESGASEAWFCDPGPEQSAVLANSLLDSLEQPANVDLEPALEPQSDFPCDQIHAGRARVTAVLLELADQGVEASAGAIISALENYFSQQRDEVLAARAAPRLVWPATGPVTSHYGPSHPLGIDIGQFAGPIIAATDGVVAFAGGNPCCSYGYYVVIDGADGIGSLYGHLSTIQVTQGQRVRQGDVLGEVGCTGACFGAHLHFEVFENGARLDPMRYLP